MQETPLKRNLILRSNLLCSYSVSTFRFSSINYVLNSDDSVSIPLSSVKYIDTTPSRYIERARRYPRGTESRAKHFLIKNTHRSHLRYKSIRGRALFTIIVVTDKLVAFPRRLIISRRKRKGLLRPDATLTSTPLSPTYTRVRLIRTYFHGHQRRVIIGLHF